MGRHPCGHPAQVSLVYFLSMKPEDFIHSLIVTVGFLPAGTQLDTMRVEVGLTWIFSQGSQ
jgi:hypothetical protein